MVTMRRVARVLPDGGVSAFAISLGFGGAGGFGIFVFGLGVRSFGVLGAAGCGVGFRVGAIRGPELPREKDDDKERGDDDEAFHEIFLCLFLSFWAPAKNSRAGSHPRRGGAKPAGFFAALRMIRVKKGTTGNPD